MKSNKFSHLDTSPRHSYSSCNDVKPALNMQTNPDPTIYRVDHCENPECRKSFSTRYKNQIYCHDPCKNPGPKRKGRPIGVKNSTKLTRKNMQENTEFNREWLTKRL